MEKLDLRKELKAFYGTSPKKIEVVDVPAFQFLQIDGLIESGLAPGTSPVFQENMHTLYGTAYALKFMSKLNKQNPINYSVMALEGLWWVEGGEYSFDRKDNWAYTLLILQPEHITAEMLTDALSQMRKKKGDQPGFARLHLESFHEGLSIQLLHVGPYTSEPESIARMDAFAAEHDYHMHGKHHEIYLGNPLTAQPEKLKTILRHPVVKSAA